MTLQKIGPWTVERTDIAYSNPWISVEHNNVRRPDGLPGIYGVVRFGGLACGVLPLAEDRTTWLVGQHRFPTDHYSWELPEGGGRLDIDPLVSTQRELSEETGLSARHWTPLGRWELSNCVTDEIAYGYLAWGLREGVAHPDPDEALKIKRVAFDDLVEMCLDGEIKDAFSVLMVTSALAHARRGTLPEAAIRLVLG